MVVDSSAMTEPPASVRAADGPPVGDTLLSRGDVLGKALVGILALRFILWFELFL